MPLNFPDDWGVRKGWFPECKPEDKIRIGDKVRVKNVIRHNLGYMAKTYNSYINKTGTVDDIIEHGSYGFLVKVILSSTDSGIYIHIDDVEKVR
jgi:hypothetical protein